MTNTDPIQDNENQSITPAPAFTETSTPPMVQPPQQTTIRVRLQERKPYVSYTILAITILVYLLQAGSEFLLGIDYPAVMGMKINDFIMQGQIWRLVTPILLHGSLLHIGFNMYALHVLGPQLEQHFGHWQFLLLYVISGFAGVVFSFILTDAASLGASTSIFGMLAAHGVLAYKNQKVFGPRAKRALRSIINIAVINFAIGLTPGIDNWAHLGGFVGGLMISWIGGPVYNLEGTLPELQAKNQRTDLELLLAAAGTSILFGIVALVVIMGQFY